MTRTVETTSIGSSAFGILSVPSLMFVPMEGRPQMSVGALPKAGLKQVIERELLAAQP